LEALLSSQASLAIGERKEDYAQIELYFGSKGLYISTVNLETCRLEQLEDSEMNKLQNVTLRVTKTKNPYRPTSFKHQLFDWALERGMFTKEEFFEAVLELKVKWEVTSKMSDEVLPKAWFNEFLNKHHDFEIVENLQ